MTKNSPMDIIIFGATGFTGKCTVIKAFKLLKGLKWGIAGRNIDKLNGLLQEVGKKFNEEQINIPIIVADVENMDSLLAMTRQCRVLINCVGPFCLYGEPVVKACLKTKTHQIDVTAEPLYMQEITEKYHETAQNNETYIVPACGFDCVPLDLGIAYVQDQFDGTVNSVEVYLKVTEYESTKGPLVHYGTWASIIQGIAKPRELLKYRRNKLYVENFKPVLKERLGLHKSEVTHNWSLPYLTSDRSVIHRSQRYFFENHSQRPAQVRVYMSATKIKELLGAILFALSMLIYTSTACGRNLLLKHYKFFSFGMVTKEDISDENMKAPKVFIHFKAKGWSSKFPKNMKNYDAEPDKELQLELSFSDLYNATADALLLCAQMLLREPENLPKRGGVFTPAVAFSKTSLVNKLQENEWMFRVVEPNQQ